MGLPDNNQAHRRLAQLRRCVGRALPLLERNEPNERSSRHAARAVAWQAAEDGLTTLLLLGALKLLESGPPPRRRAGGIAYKPWCRTEGSLSGSVNRLYGKLAGLREDIPGAALKPPHEISERTLERVWQELSDPALSPLWHDECVLGYLYQLASAHHRKASQASIQSANKTLTVRSLVGFTQLYTPRWVVEFLNQNTILPLWAGSARQDGECGSGAQRRWPFFVGHQLPDRRFKAEELTMLDPACGSGHFLLPAFDLLTELYCAEGKPLTQAVHLALTTNLAGADIDETGLAVLALSLLIKCKRLGADPGALKDMRLSSVCEHIDTANGASLLGSLAPRWSAESGHALSRKYKVVATNPPYIGRKLLDREMKQLLKALYPRSHQDLCAAFVERGLAMLEEGGRLGVITQASLLYLPAYEELRRALLTDRSLIVAVEAGPGVFPLQGGEKVNSALLVAQAEDAVLSPGQGTCLFLDIDGQRNKEEALARLVAAAESGGGAGCYARELKDFSRYPRAAFNYRCPAFVVRLNEQLPQLAGYAEIRQGLATTDNARFVRYWWDVAAEDIGRRWYPYVKGGAGSQRWYAALEHVVDWEDDGAAIKAAVANAYPYLRGKTSWVVKNEQFYFREGLTFSFVNSGAFAVRRLPAGCIFDVAGSALFAEPEMMDFLLGYLNSSLAVGLAALLSPTINVQVGDLKRLPVVPMRSAAQKELSLLAEQCYRLKRRLGRFQVTAIDNPVPAEAIGIARGASPVSVWKHCLSDTNEALEELANLEAALDRLVLSELAQAGLLDKSQIADVKAWLNVEAESARQIVCCPASESDFARLVVHYLLILLGDSASGEEAAQANCTHPRLAVEPPVIIPCDGDLPYGLPAFTGETLSWLKKQLGMPVSVYLAREFGREESRRFHGSPYLFALPIGATPWLLVFSSRTLRHLAGLTGSARDKFWSASRQLYLKDGLRDSHVYEPGDEGGALETADKMLSAFSGRLSATADWTGADLSTLACLDN